MSEINKTNNWMHHRDQSAEILNDKVIDLAQSEQKHKSKSINYIFLFILGLSCINIVAITCLPILPGCFLLRSFYQASPIPMTMVA